MGRSDYNASKPLPCSPCTVATIDTTDFRQYFLYPLYEMFRIPIGGRDRTVTTKSTSRRQCGFQTRLEVLRHFTPWADAKKTRIFFPPSRASWHILHYRQILIIFFHICTSKRSQGKLNWSFLFCTLINCQYNFQRISSSPSIYIW